MNGPLLHKRQKARAHYRSVVCAGSSKTSYVSYKYEYILSSKRRSKVRSGPSAEQQPLQLARIQRCAREEPSRNVFQAKPTPTHTHTHTHPRHAYHVAELPTEQSADSSSIGRGDKRRRARRNLSLCVGGAKCVFCEASGFGVFELRSSGPLSPASDRPRSRRAGRVGERVGVSVCYSLFTSAGSHARTCEYHVILNSMRVCVCVWGAVYVHVLSVLQCMLTERVCVCVCVWVRGVHKAIM